MPAALSSASEPCFAPIRRAVIPAAGLGTRLLPATRAQPKEMLPLGTTPVIQIVAQELLSAGLSQALIITGSGKESIEDHFDPAYNSDNVPDAPHPDLDVFDRANLQLYYTRQATPRGLGDALLHAADFARDDDFVVALGDCAIVGDGRPGLLERLVATHRTHGAAATIAVQRVSAEQTRRYGIVAVSPSDSDVPNSGEVGWPAWRATGIVEKPGPEAAPSRWAVSARYVFSPRLFDFLRQTPPGYGGEIQLTDAIAAMITAGLPVWVVPLDEKEIRLDVGNSLAYGKAFIRTVLSQPETGPALRDYVAALLDLWAGRASQDPDRAGD
jgi:UTP--glucose-1-phosphate uridylyltransferase